MKKYQLVKPSSVCRIDTVPRGWLGGYARDHIHAFDNAAEYAETGVEAGLRSDNDEDPHSRASGLHLAGMGRVELQGGGYRSGYVFVGIDLIGYSRV
jgi:hypothetical protein